MKTLINMLLFVGKKPVLYLCLTLMLVSILRLPAYNKSVIDWDESIYLLAGDNILQGGTPYKELWDNKGPLLYFIFAFIIKATGHSIIGLRLFTTLWVLLTSFLIYLIGKKLHNELSGIFSSLFFIIASSSFALGGLASNAEIFFILPALIGVYIALFYEVTIKNALCSGLFLGLAFTIKSISIFDFAALLLFVFLTVKKKERSLSKSIYAALLCSAGFLIPFLVFMAYFQSRGFLDGFLKTYFEYSSKYVFGSFGIFYSIRETVFFLWSTIFPNIGAICILCLAAIVSYALGLYERNEKVKFLILWLFSVLIGIMIHHRFFTHIFIQALPSLCLLGGFALATIVSSDVNKYASVFLGLYLALGMIFPITDNLRYLKKVLLCETNMELNDTPARVSRYLKPNLDASGSIYVPNEIPIVYFLTHAGIPTRYANPSILQRPEIYEGMLGINHAEEVRKILNKNPSYIILTQTNTIISKEVDYFFRDYLQENYLLEKDIDNVHIYRYKNTRAKY